MMADLERIFAGWLRWFRLRRAKRWGLRGLPAGLAIGLAAGLALLAWRKVLSGEFAGLVIGCGLAGLLAALAAGNFWPLHRMALARWFDLRFGLRERVSTAMELNEPGSDVPAAWRERQLADTLSAARQVEPGRLAPYRLERAPVFLSAGLALVMAILLLVGRPWFEETQQQRDVQRTIQEEKARVSELIQKIERTQELTPAQRQELAEPLKEALRKLEEARSREQALSTLNEAEGKLRAMQSQQTQTELEELGKAGEALSQAEVQGLKQAGEALANGPSDAGLNEALQELKNTDLGSLSEEQRQSAAQALEQAAQQLQESNPMLSEQLNQAAQALQQGDAQAAQQALERAAQQLGQVQLRVAQSRAAGEAANQLQPGQAGQNWQGQNGQDGQGQNGQGQTGQGQMGQDGQGQNGQGQMGQNGQGQSGQEQGQGSTGAGRGDQTGAEAPGGEAPNRPIGQDNGPGDGGQREYEKIYDPSRLGGEHDLGLGAPPSEQPGDQIVGQQGSSPGTEGESQVPYVDVLPAYQEAMRQAMQNGEIPAYLRPVIRAYFSSLEP
jgi:hypothetical protein